MGNKKFKDMTIADISRMYHNQPHIINAPVYILTHGTKVLGAYKTQAQAMQDGEICNQGSLKWRNEYTDRVGTQRLAAYGRHNDEYRVQETIIHLG